MWQNVINQLDESFLNSFSVVDEYILTNFKNCNQVKPGAVFVLWFRQLKSKLMQKSIKLVSQFAFLRLTQTSHDVLQGRLGNFSEISF